MKTQKNYTTTCPYCNQEFNTTVLVDSAGSLPDIRCNLEPSGQIYVYRITSDDIKSFVVDKAKSLGSKAKVECAPMYIERKRRSDGKRISYASIRIAFTEEALENNGSDNYYVRLGESGESTKLIKTMFNNIYERYRFRDDEVNGWLSSYKTMERLEENFGISEEYLRDLKSFTHPNRFTDASGVDWIFFSASAERIIKNMLETPDQKDDSGRVIHYGSPGRVSIEAVYPLSKENVEFLVYLHVNESDIPEDPRVRQILQHQGHKNK